MRWACWVAGLALSLGGCASSSEERVREYNQDGLQLFQQGEYQAARETFQAALALKPEDPALFYNIGECYARQNDAVQAQRYYNECLQRAPNHIACRHALADLMVHGGHWPEASSMVEDWLKREPKLAAAYAEDGWLCHQAGDLPKAHSRLQQALELDPHNERALNEMALVYEALHRPDRALVLYERSLAQNPKQPDVVNRLNLLQAEGAGRPKPE